LKMSVVEAGPQTVLRRRRLIAQGGEEYVTITLQQRGTARLTQDGREVLVNPGTFTCTDTVRTWFSSLSSDSCSSLKSRAGNPAGV